jgi:hypothetical protein
MPPAGGPPKFLLGELSFAPNGIHDCGKAAIAYTIRANSVQRSKTDKSNAPTSDRIIMGCQQSKTTRINTSSHNSLDKKPKTKKNGSYETKGGNVTLTTKTFRAVGDPHSILHTTPTKPPKRPSSSTTLLQQQQESSAFPASLLADYDIVKQIGEGPASRIFLVRSKQKKTQRRNIDHRRVPNNEGVDEEGCSSSACSSTEPDLSEDEALLTTTRPRREAAVDDDDDGHYNQFLVLQQLNVSHLSDRKRRRLVKEIRSIQETVDHPHSTSSVVKLLCWLPTTQTLTIIPSRFLFTH